MIDLKNMDRRRFMGLAGMTAASSLMLPQWSRPAFGATPLAAVKEEDAVIGFGHVGPISDEGWTWSHHQGLEAVKAAFPKAEISRSREHPLLGRLHAHLPPDVSDGANMIISTSNYGDLIYEVSDRATDVAFMECDGHRKADNLSYYYIQHWFPTYVAGVAAGLLSKSGKLGYVASFPVPAVFCGTNAFLMGARTVNPEATLQTVGSTRGSTRRAPSRPAPR